VNTAVIQHGEQFVLFAALDPATREVVHLGVAPSRNYLTTRWFLEEIEELYGELPEVVITDGARGYGAAFGRLRIRHRVLVHGSRNRIERWMQELKRRIDTFYASFTGDTAEPTHNWLRQFTWLESPPILTLPPCRVVQYRDVTLRQVSDSIERRLRRHN